jgi:hypothetical protein
MDSATITWIIFGLVSIGFVYFMVRVSKENVLKSAKKIELRELYKNDAVFLCDSIEDLNHQNEYQIRGESTSVVIKPGSKIDIAGIGCTVINVYRPFIYEGTNRRLKDASYPNENIPASTDGAAIVFQIIQGFNFTAFKSRLKKEKVIAIKVQE